MQVGSAIARARRNLRGDAADTARDVRLLVAQAVGRPMAWVLAHPEGELSKDQEAWFDEAFARYRRGEPLPYILGWWEFYGRRFRVDPRVLIPRPETETLVDRVLDRLRRRSDGIEIVDVGTGSGCIAVTLAAELPRGRATAIDISDGALRVARDNAKLHGVEGRIRFLRGHLLTAMRSSSDVIVANLPYLPSSRLPRLPVAAHEPVVALDGGPNGQAALRELAAQLPTHLKKGGLAAIEIDEGQGQALMAMIESVMPDADAQVEPDLAGRERFVLIDRPATP